MQDKNNLLVKKCEIYDSLFCCNSIEQILNITENHLNNPIFLLDTSYRIIARSNLAKEDNSSIERHNGEDYLLLDTIDLMKKNKCIDNIYNSNNSFFHLSDENLIFCSIRINNITAAYIGVLQRERNFLEEDLELTNILSKVLSIQMQKDNLFISDSGLDEEYYLIDLLTNKLEDMKYIKERLQYINFNLNNNLIMISIPFQQKYKDYRHNFGLQGLIKTLKDIFKNCIATYYNNMMVFLISSDHVEVINDYTREKLYEFLKLNSLHCGVSMTFESLLYIQDFFYQSIYALELSQHLKNHGNVHYFENYIEHYLFSLCDNINNNLYRINLSSLIHPWINKLIEYDKKNKTELLKTLKVYIENNRNANDTSSKLNIHRSTFFYRFSKIQSLLGSSLDLDDKLFILELSFKIINYKAFKTI